MEQISKCPMKKLSKLSKIPNLIEAIKSAFRTGVFEDPKKFSYLLYQELDREFIGFVKNKYFNEFDDVDNIIKNIQNKSLLGELGDINDLREFIYQKFEDDFDFWINNTEGIGEKIDLIDNIKNKNFRFELEYRNNILNGISPMINHFLATIYFHKYISFDKINKISIEDAQIGLIYSQISSLCNLVYAYYKKQNLPTNKEYILIEVNSLLNIASAGDDPSDIYDLFVEYYDGELPFDGNDIYNFRIDKEKLSNSDEYNDFFDRFSELIINKTISGTMGNKANYFMTGGQNITDNIYGCPMLPNFKQYWKMMVIYFDKYYSK